MSVDIYDDDTPEEIVERIIDDYRLRLAQKQAKLNMRDWNIPPNKIGFVLASPTSYLTPEQDELISRQVPEFLIERGNAAPMKGDTLVIEPSDAFGPGRD